MSALLVEFLLKAWPYILIVVLIAALVLGYKLEEASKADLQSSLAIEQTKNAVQDTTIATMKNQMDIIQKVTDDHNARMAAAEQQLQSVQAQLKNINLNQLATSDSKTLTTQMNAVTTQFIQGIVQDTQQNAFTAPTLGAPAK